VVLFRIILVLIVLAAAAPLPLLAQEGDGDAAAGKKEKESNDPLSSLPGWLGGKEAQFFRLPMFNVPVIRGGQIVGQVSLSVMVETTDIRNKDTIIENRAKLQNGFLRDLHGVVSIDNGSGRALNVPTVKARLVRVAEKILGPGIVSNVLVENVYVRQFD
jgi:hypothetical protein